MESAWQDGEKIFCKRKDSQEKLENLLHELKRVANYFIPQGEKSFNRKWNRIIVSLSGHFNSLDELECIWDELKESQCKKSVSQKSKTKDVGTQKDDLIHWHSVILDADENGNEVLPELEPIDAQEAECKEEPDDNPSVVGDKYIPQKPVEEPANKKKIKKKQKRRCVLPTNTSLPTPPVCSNHTGAVPKKLTRSRKRQQTEDLPCGKQLTEHFTELNNFDVQTYVAHDHFASPIEEDSDEKNTDVVKKIKLKRYAKSPD
ncbi:unnamed protein product [Oikopleura dioica]|uniref:Uncharacterized protein n=1 Tax=Oikopleura dioica TaxID=34765 RepID=E4WXV9_OIKDI|nr:unnamed protein product [Oikopleura dioica]CBY32286.1 unnamed protein product [Oikopleura dioica]CBY38354.1 unnamed protein product [Oikopleura dioica]